MRNFAKCLFSGASTVERRVQLRREGGGGGAGGGGGYAGTRGTSGAAADGGAQRGGAKLAALAKLTGRRSPLYLTT